GSGAVDDFGAHAGDRYQDQRRTGRCSEEGGHTDAARSDENGAADARIRRRDGGGGLLPRRRARDGGRRPGGIQMITVVEVGPRDGLQNEAAAVSTADKIAFVNHLTAAHLPVIEVSAFVSPKWVPQMADAAEVFAGITRRPGTRYTALVPNLPGLDRAVAAGVTEIAVFAAASETFSRKNINQGIDDSIATYRQ